VGQYPYSIDDFFRRMTTILAAPSPRQTQFRMNAAFPVDDQNNFTRFSIDVGDDFINQCPYNTFFQTDVSSRRIPYVF